MTKHYEAVVKHNRLPDEEDAKFMEAYLIKLVMIHLDYNTKTHEDEEEKLVFSVQAFLKDRGLWEAV